MSSSRRLFAIAIILGALFFLLQYQIFSIRSIILHGIEKDQYSNLNARSQSLENVYDTDANKKVPRSYDDSLVVLYNRVPKTASTSFMMVVYALAKSNNFNALYVNITDKFAKGRDMSLLDQAMLVKNITTWDKAKPAFYHGHLPFLNFATFGSQLQPVYINIIRDPLDRMVSYYYFLRYGDNFRPHKKRQKMHDKVTLDECVSQKRTDCHPDKLWAQVRYFCGHLPQCYIPGSTWALKQAKRHLSDNYFLVGVTEQLEKFIEALELSLPRFFKGALEKYQADGGIFLRKTAKKEAISNASREYFKKSKVWKMENEFYKFALETFKGKYELLIKRARKRLLRKTKMFDYQKVIWGHKHS